MVRKSLTALALGAGAAVAAIAALTLPGPATSVQAATFIPASEINVPRTGNSQVAILAGGCFWGMEAVFEHVDGVRSVTSGYVGGSADTASYSQVSSETTGHAEAVRIIYDPREVSYAHLLRIYFAVAHDPTQVNRQGPDTGPSYRSAIFPQDARQRQVAQSYIAQLDRTGRFDRPIATRIESGRFYDAEASHQNFMQRNPRHPYILAHDVPKVRDLRQSFPSDWRAASAD